MKIKNWRYMTLEKYSKVVQYAVMGIVSFFLGYPIFSQATSIQPIRHSPSCYLGNSESERLFEQGLDYEVGRKNVEVDLFKAERFYEKALRQGNPKAALYLGRIYRQGYMKVPGYSSRLKFQITLFEQAISMGCPDGYFYLAEAYQNGWGVHANMSTAWDFIRQGAQKGSLVCMTALGTNLYFENRFEKEPIAEEKRKEAKKWLEQALSRGYGAAGYELALIYRIYEHDPYNAIRTLRLAAKLGNLDAFYMLSDIYKNGQDGQEKDVAYASKIDALRQKINPLEFPFPIKNFDQQIPLKKVLPYQPQKPRLMPVILEEPISNESP